jgi:ubiquinone/menaquinone biosynthesis C-methylase UbiE
MGSSGTIKQSLSNSNKRQMAVKDFTSPGSNGELSDALSRTEMIHGVNIHDYFMMCREQHPRLYRLLKPNRLSAENIAEVYAGIAELATHFEGKLEKGRGDSYREAQNANYLIRSVGFLQLFDIATREQNNSGAGFMFLDALGGNGTLTRIVRASRAANQIPFIVTNDVSSKMIESALAQGLPAIRQPLQNLVWFDDCTFDAVTVSYGTHHIPPHQRFAAISEAYRVLKPGGRIVLQDFEIGCPTTDWYDKVLHHYTLTGHHYEYFTKTQFHDLLAGNNFSEVEILDIYDPFILKHVDRKEAHHQLLLYLFTLFGLEKLLPSDGEPKKQFWDQLESLVRKTSTFNHEQLPPGISSVSEFTISWDGENYRAEIPRVCLVATGRRPD